MDDLPDAAARGALWSALGRWGSKVIALATFAILARLLEPAEFGLLAFAVAVVEILRQIGQQGLMQAVIREPHLTDRQIHTAVWLNLGANLVLGGLLFAASYPAEALSGLDGLGNVLAVLSFYLVVVGLSAIPEALLQRELRFDALATRSIVSTVIGSVVALVLAFGGAGVWALVAQYMVQGLVGLVLVWKASRYRMAFTFDMTHARALLRFGWTVLAIDVATVVMLFGDNFVIFALLGEAALGYYTIAYRLMATLVDLLGGVLTTLALPVLSRLQDEPPRLVNGLRRITKTILLLASPVFLSLAVASTGVVPLIFGEKWSPAAPVLTVLSVGAVFWVATYADRAAMFSINRPGVELGLVTVGALATVAGAALGSSWGVVGAAAGVSARMFMMLFVRVVVMSWVLPLRPVPYLASLVPVLLAGAVGLAVGTGTRLLTSDAVGNWSAWVGGVLTAMAFFVAVVVLDRSFVAESASLARRAVARRSS